MQPKPGTAEPQPEQPMSENKTNRLSQVVFFVCVASVIGMTLKAIDWLIPSPDRKLIVCMNADTGKGICKTLADIEAAHAKNLPAFTDEARK